MAAKSNLKSFSFQFEFCFFFPVLHFFFKQANYLDNYFHIYTHTHIICKPMILRPVTFIQLYNISQPKLIYRPSHLTKPFSLRTSNNCHRVENVQRGLEEDKQFYTCTKILIRASQSQVRNNIIIVLIREYNSIIIERARERDFNHNFVMVKYH